MVFSIELPLRWGDMDAQGHVNNGAYADYMQEARVDFLHEGGDATMLDTGVVVTGHQIEYLAPATFSNAPLEVRIGLLEVRAARFLVGYELRHEGVLCARATTTACPFDLESQRPRKLSASERTWFEANRWSQWEPFRDLSAPALQGRGHRHPLRTRWSDVDRYAHVNNVKLFDYVQEARIAMTTQADPEMARPGTGGESGDFTWLVVRQDVDYVAQIGFRTEPYHAITAPVRLGTSSSVYACEVVDPLDGDRLLARARTVLVCADRDGVPTSLPDPTREKLSQLIVD